MKCLSDHHHYKKNKIPVEDVVAIYERYLIDLLLNSNVDDNNRESSIAFELKHHHSTAQFARVLSCKRNLPVDVCVVGALLHDLYVVEYGSYKDHAHKSAELASKVLKKIGGFNALDKDRITRIIYNHSDKHIWSNDPYEEFGKDVDILDCFLYPGAFGYYLKHKRLNVFYNYILRAKRIWDELHIPQPIDFSILDDYGDKWLNKKYIIIGINLEYLLKLISYFVDFKQYVPTFCLYKTKDSYDLYINNENSKRFIKVLLDNYLIKIDSFNTDWQSVYNTITNQRAELNYSKNDEIFKVAEGTYVIVWSGIDAYEILNKKQDSQRLMDLGIVK